MKKLKLFTASVTGIGRFLLSISFRLMLFNIILVFLPVASILYLDTYERQLLDAQEKSMVQQGRLLSAALSNSENPDVPDAVRILTNLKGRTETRLRILDIKGMLIADSSLLYKAEIPDQDISYKTISSSIPSIDKESVLYRIAIWPVHIYRKIFQPPLPVAGESYYNSSKPLDGPEIQAALDGRYGAVTRLSSDGQRSVSLYIAIPILNEETVTGAILCSQSTYRILQDMYEIRLALLKIFLWSFLFALIISAVLAFSISFRIKRLRNDAESIRTGKGRLEGYFTPSSFMDEIGELSFSLKDLTSRLDNHIRNTASFIQDFSHEFKNPLSVVRTASEMIPDSTGLQRDRFIQLIDQNSRRMESLLEGIREFSLIDRDLEEEIKNPVIVKTLLENLIDGFRVKYPDSNWVIRCYADSTSVLGTEDKIGRIFINILENANSFASKGSSIKINLNNNPWNNQLEIEISNHGTHISEGDLVRVFDRFYSNRSNGEQDHNGLGLSIVRAILNSYKGSIKVQNTEQGVCFTVILPLNN